MTPLEKFTPGPWEVGWANGLTGPNMSTMAAFDFERNKVIPISGPRQTLIAAVPQLEGANADLIAVATDMYRELFRALAVITNPQAFDIEGVRSDIANVLRNARGEK